MDYSQVTDFINKAKKFGSRLDLTRIEKLCALLGHPERKSRFVHVAGTNGKGSVSVYLENILASSGLTVGLFTSPFIYDFNERIQINNVPISDSDLLFCMEEVVRATEQMIEEGFEHPTEFELITAAAFLYFKHKECDIVVLEVGLGGRLDATNVIQKPLVSVITSISFDHMEYLGTTLAEIAENKCGIIKKGCPVVSYPNQPAEAMRVMEETAKRRESVLKVPDGELTIHESGLAGNRFTYEGEAYETALVGTFQVYNAVTAIAAVKCLQSGGVLISEEHIRQGLMRAKWPARFELLRKSPVVILDGSHNADGMRAFVETAKTCLCGKKAICVFGMLKDKDYASCLSMLSEVTDTVVVTEVDNPRKESAETLAQTAKQFIPHVHAEKNNRDAVALAKKLAKDTDAIICLGSLYMMKDIRDAVEDLFAPDTKQTEGKQ